MMCRLQHPQEPGWPQPGQMTNPPEMSPHGPMSGPPMPGGPMPGIPGGPPAFMQRPGAQLSPRTPSPFPTQSPGGMYPPSHSPALQSPTLGPQPVRPPAPPQGKLTQKWISFRS